MVGLLFLFFASVAFGQTTPNNPCLLNPCLPTEQCIQTDTPTGIQHECIGTGGGVQNLCQPNPCRPNEQCIMRRTAVGVDYQCIRTDTPSPCDTNPCRPTEDCVAMGDTYQCVPHSGGGGSDPCMTNPCRPGEQCIPRMGPSGVVEYQCRRRGPVGPNPCRPNPCRPDEECITAPTLQGRGYRCKRLPLNPCMMNPCQPGEICIPDQGPCLVHPCMNYRCEPRQPRTQCSDPMKEFLQCGSPCQRGCDDPEPDPYCSRQCVSGCFCKAPYVRERADYPDSPCVMPDQCPPRPCADPRKEYRTCGTDCPASCQNRNPFGSCTERCVEGCYCREPYILRDDNPESDCVLPVSCNRL